MFADLNIEIQEAEDILKLAVGANKLKGADGPSTSSVLKGRLPVYWFLVPCFLIV